MKLIKKLSIIGLLAMISCTPIFAWTNVSVSAYEGSAHAFDYVHVTTTDYININGITYVPVSFLENIAPKAKQGTAYEYNDDMYIDVIFDKERNTIYIQNDLWISSIRSSKYFWVALEIDNPVYYLKNHMLESDDYFTAVAAPKLIDGVPYIPLRTIADLFSYGKINFDPQSKAVSFKISLGG